MLMAMDSCMSGYYYAYQISCDDTGYCNKYAVTCTADEEYYCAEYTVDTDTNTGF